jgi:formylglycine-generating enzyme required for sulfatase activity
MFGELELSTGWAEFEECFIHERIFMPIFPTQPAVPQMRVVNGIPMVDLPGGVFAMGSQATHEKFGNSQPRMVRVEQFAAGVTHVTEGQYSETVGRAGREGAPGNHPATYINIADCKEFLQKRNQGKGESEQIGFLTEAELEYIARGPVLDIRQLMARERIRGAAALAAYLKGKNGSYLENFVSTLDLGATIVATPTSAGFKELIDGASPVLAWRSWGTRSGRLNPAEAWYDQRGTAPVSLTKRVNGYGVSDAIGNAWSWGADRYKQNAYEVLPQENPYNEPFNGSEIIVLRGGSWYSNHPLVLRAAFRRGVSAPVFRYDGFGLRVGARPQDSH